MYLDNPKRLFMDLYRIKTMYCYMVACAEDGEDENLQNLLSIVGCNRGELHYGGEGSCRWDLEQCDTEEERQQKIKDSRKIDAIYKQIQKELNAKYVIQCRECGYTWFMSRKSKYVKLLLDKELKSGLKCFCNGRLDAFTMKKWLKDNKIDLKEITRYM